MKTYDELGARRPEWLVDQWDLDDLVDALAPVGTHDESLTNVVDYLFVHWVGEALAFSEDPWSLARMSTGVRRILQIVDCEAGIRGRWEMLIALLELRRVQLLAKEPERIRAMQHVGAILDCLASKDHPMSQGEIREQLQLRITPSRLSQIVRLMRVNGLVRTRRRGREVLVELVAHDSRHDRSQANLAFAK